MAALVLLILQDSDLSGLLEARWTPAHWHLLWLLAAPLFWFLYRWYYRQFMVPPEQSWEHEQPEMDIYKPVPEDEVTKRKRGPAPERVAEVMRRYEYPWAIAGGWALDLHLGKVTRVHQDIEIAVLRRDQQALRQYLTGWQPMYVVPGAGTEPVPWPAGEELKLPVHELHTRPPQADIMNLEILLNEADGEDWVYRRDSRARLPLSRAFLATAAGIPYLAPEVVLLYKSKQPRERDEQDFNAAVDVLAPPQRAWLRDALQAVSPGHPWLARLD